MVAGVVSTFADWHATLWGKISVDSLVEECKRMTKEARTLNKAVRSYEARRQLCTLGGRLAAVLCAKAACF